MNTTESNIGSPRSDWPPSGEHLGPDVVWLSSKETSEGLGALYAKVADSGGRVIDGLVVDKTEVRITVDVDDAMPWTFFATIHGMHPEWRRAIEHGQEPERWYVCTRPISADEWVAIEDSTTGEPLAVRG